MIENYYENNKTKTYKELCLMARGKNIKYFAKYTKNQLEEMLGLEISNPNELKKRKK